MDDNEAPPEQTVPTDDEIDDMFSHPKEPNVVASSEDASPPRRGRARFAMVGLVAAGAAVGVIAVSQLNGNSSATTAANAGPGNGAAIGQPPGAGNGRLPGGQAPGGLAGEQRVSGTVTAVGSSSVTVRTSSGAATYAVTSASQIIRNGQSVSLSAVQAGDAVFAHVYPVNGKMTVERLFAGTSATANNGPGGPPPGTPNNGTQSGTTSTT
jgi:hypothetical protein